MKARTFSLATTALATTAVAIASAAWTAGCGGSGSAGFGGGQGGGPPGTGAAPDGGGSPDATVFSLGDGGAGSFFQTAEGDGGESVQSACVAGVYNGAFTTSVNPGSGDAAPSLFSFMWNGNVSIDLAARKVVVVQNGGEGNLSSTSVLEIAEGGVLEGGDMYGGVFSADMSGSLDCAADAGPPYRLSASLSNGIYSDAFLGIPITGSLSADYQPSNPPKLVNGTMEITGHFNDSGMANATATGTWSATWVSP
jgi:hypothetical protein